MAGVDLGIDLGTTKIIVYRREKESFWRNQAL